MMDMLYIYIYVEYITYEIYERDSFSVILLQWFYYPITRKVL